MFDAAVYIERRDILRKKIESGIILFLTNNESPMNYADNTYRFRQDSSFLYYLGLDSPGLAAIVDVEASQDIIFGNELDIDDIIWMGPQPPLQERASRVGVNQIFPLKKLNEIIRLAVEKGRTVHFLPPYRSEHVLLIKELLGITENFVKDYASVTLIKAIVEQRSVKSEQEIEQIELAHAATYEMHTLAMKMARPGMYEREIAGAIEGIALSKGASVSFPVILSIRGDILHNHYHDNKMSEGDLLINDSGAESVMHYAADITRTFPVSGKFTSKQKDIYDIVLKSQLDSIKAIKPEVKYRDVHLLAGKVIAEGLKNLGLMKGDMDEAVRIGAHALFFPHGLGHMMGLDVHDMENLGEDYVGYDDEIKRSDQFGLAYLRLAKRLKPGYVLTVEPGIYFIPALIEKWKNENKFSRFINYSRVEEFIGFGGIRIEDDVLVNDSGVKVIGKPIPKTVSDVEEMCRIS